MGSHALERHRWSPDRADRHPPGAAVGQRRPALQRRPHQPRLGRADPRPAPRHDLGPPGVRGPVAGRTGRRRNRQHHHPRRAYEADTHRALTSGGTVMDASRDETRSLLGPTLIGTGLQLAMVLAGHYSPGVAQFFPAGGMAISAVAGALAALGLLARLARLRRRKRRRGGRCVRLRRHSGLVFPWATCPPPCSGSGRPARRSPAPSAVSSARCSPRGAAQRA